ncbi:MAG: hypothetical protein HY319_24845 [Armatimonadetes bacterium]|nr:hypothetical protein [Armatimonadota bacterium]
MEIARPGYLIFEPPAPAPELTSGCLRSGLWHASMERLLALFEPPQIATGPVPGRQGEILAPDTILKADQYPGLHQKRLQDGRTRDPQPLLNGAPNYRQRGEGIHGVAQPTVEGIRNVLEEAGAAPGGPKEAVWTNLREEPVVYVNGVPFNLRQLDRPMNNLEAPGRRPEEVAELEKKLQAEMLQEASRNGGYLILHDELPGGKLAERRVKVESVQTVDEVFEGLQKEGFRVRHQRIPVTDTKKPEDQDLDRLVESLKDVDPDAALIFNCHAGQGRTTTAMVVASLMRRAGQDPEEREPLNREAALREDLKEQGGFQPRNYRSVLRGLRDAQKLASGQKDLDQLIEQYSDVYDLKGAVRKERDGASSARTPAEREQAAGRFANALERYYTLVAFEQYAQENGPDFRRSFSDWKKSQPDLEENLKQLQVARQRLSGEATRYA